MANSVDQRIVNMKFDNAQFEKGVSKTMNTLQKLNEKLQFKNAKKGFKDIEESSNKVKFSGLLSAVESISQKFNAMGVVGFTVFQNLTNSAINAGKQIASAFTIDPIKTGFQEYETQINAVQTILANTASKGTNLQQVNAALDELNRYADMTIYNFTEMTRNIGTFTAAGVDLDTSTQAIKGIANLAAVSGSNSQQASTAMYQLSQALAAGTVKLMDWNSVVNAGMGGQVFQDALKETARVHGIAIDDMIEKNGSFRETLQEGWLSSEILTETLAKFTGDLTEEQLRSIGYTDEQIADIMEMGRTANDAATKVKTFTQLMDTLKEAAQSGWTQSWEIIIGDFEEAKEFLTEISDTFSDIINESANARNEVLQGWKDLGGRTALIDSLRNIFQGVMSIMKPIKEAFAEIFPPVTAQNLYNFTVKLKDLTALLKINDETADKLKRTFKGVFSVLDIGKQIIMTVANVVGKLISKIFGMSGSFLNAAASLGDFLTGLDEQIKSSGVLTFVIDKATAVIDKLANIASRVSQLVLKAFKTVTHGISSFMNMGVDFAIALGDKIAPILSGIAHKIMDVFKNIISNINLENILGTLTVGLSGGLLVVIMKFVKKITGFMDNLSEGFGLLDSVKDAISGLTDTLSTLQTAVKAHSILAIAVAVGILAGAMVALSSIDAASLARALGGLSGIFVNLIGSLYLLEGMDFTKGGFSLLKMAGFMIGLAVAVDLLAVAVKKLSSLSWRELAKGLGSVGILLLELVGFLKLVSIGNVSAKGIGNLVLLGAAMNLLALAVKQLSQMNSKELIKGLGSVGVLLLELAGFTHIIGDTKGLISAGVAMIAIGAAMNILYFAVKSFSSLSIKELAKGLGTMGAALAIIAGAMQIMPKTMLANSASLILIASSLNILAGALSVMGDMSLETIAKGLFTLGASLVIIAGAMELMKGSLSGAAALNAITFALMFLTPVLLTLGSMSLESIGKSLLALAGTFAVFGAAAAILGPVIPEMLGLSGAVALLGAGMLAAGTGVLALSIGLAALGASGAAGIAALVAAIEAVIGLIPTAFTKIGEGIVALLNVIAGSFDALVGAIKTVLLSILRAITEILPTLGETIIALITTICDIIIQSAPVVGQALLTILQTLLQIIIDSIPMIVEAGVQMILAFIQGIADNMISITNAVILGIVYFIRTVSEQLHTIINAAIQMAIAFINGLADGIRNNQQPFKDAIINLIKAIGNFIGSCISDLIGFGGNIIDGLVQGIGEAGHRLVEALGNVVGGAVDWVKDLLGIHSPSRVFMEIALFCIKGWVNMFGQKGNLMTQAAGRTAKNSVEAFSEAISSIPETLDSDMDFFPTITPVVDLSNVDKSISDMGSMFGSPFGLDLSSTIDLSKAAISRKEIDDLGGGSVNVINNYDMTQNNYSPKALSRIDIYRNTKAQFSRLKGVTSLS